MERRTFLGNILAGGLVTGTAAKWAPAAVKPEMLAKPKENTPNVLPRSRWVDEGVIDAGGTHEPYVFVVRRGGQRLDAYQQYQDAQSEQTIRHLKDQGVEIFHTHFYKGFGMAAEKQAMEETKRATEIAHSLGMKVDTYIQWNTMMYEAFFAEEPRAQNWIERDVDGRPIMLTYGYQQSFRYRPCFSNQEYLDYLKKIVRYAVEEVKTDFIHFDNFDLSPEPDSCHSAACVQGFRNFLKAKYTADQRRERFGFENVDYVNPPQWNRGNPPEKMEIIFDPAIQEWVDYRCHIMASGLRQMAGFAKSLNPSVAIEINPHGITGGNRAWENGIDHARLLTSTEVFWTEEQNPAAYHSDGRLVSKIRSYKLARRYNNVLLTHLSDNPVELAEDLAFNQMPGYVGEDPLPSNIRKYVSFYRENRELFTGTRDLANVAVLRSFPSITYHNARAQMTAILVEQALIQARIPFHLIFDEDTNHLDRYHVVVLPDSECLSDAQLSSIRNFVQSGGGLLVTGQTGLYDEWRRLRVEPGLRGLVEGQAPVQAYEEHVRTARATAGLPVRKEAGNGRVVYISGVEYDGPVPEQQPYFVIGNRFWKRPKNSEEIVEAVRWAAKDDIPLEVNGPEFLVANLVEHPDRQRSLIHLVNYNAGGVESISSTDVQYQLRPGREASQVIAYSPDHDGPQTISFSKNGSAIFFTIPEIKVYSIVAVS